MNLEEARLQAQCYQWYHNTYPSNRGMLFAINNNSVDARKGAINKAIGVVAGVSDMVLLSTDMVYFLEFKTLNGVQSEKQKIFEQNTKKCKNSLYIIIRSFEQFDQLVKNL